MHPKYSVQADTHDTKQACAPIALTDS